MERMVLLAPVQTESRHSRVHERLVQAEAVMADGQTRESCVASEDLFSELFQSYFPQLVRFFGHRGFDSELSRDLAQETMLRAFQGLDRFEGRAQHRTWILQIAAHLAQNWIRDQRQTLKRAGQETSMEEARRAGREFTSAESLWSRRRVLDPEEQATSRQILEQVRHAMNDLSPRQRQCLTLWLEHHKYHEIGEKLGISTQAVRSILNQAKTRVQLKMAEKQDASQTSWRGR